MSVTAASKRLCDLGEGPHWDQRTGKLFYVDAFVGCICRLDPQTGDTDTVEFDKCVTIVIPYETSTSDFIISYRNEVKKLNFETKKVEKIAAIDAENPETRFNDGKCDPKGRLWIGSLHEAQKEDGCLYTLSKTHQLQPVVDKIRLSNGITWSLDYQTMYYVDSVARKIYAFDFNLEAGTISNQRIFIDYNAKKEYDELGMPDGMTTDTEGKIWVACYGSGCILRIDPDTKSIMQKVDIPAKQVTSCCFGGPNLDILYVTTACRDNSDEEKKQYPQAGAVFAVRNLGVRGQPLFNFKD